MGAPKLKPTDKELLETYPIRLVGSALRKTNPRDVDLIMTIPDTLFRLLFGDIDQWERESETGEWTQIRRSWSDCCVRISRALWHRFGREHQQIDFKIVPESRPDHGR